MKQAVTVKRAIHIAKKVTVMRQKGLTAQETHVSDISASVLFFISGRLDQLFIVLSKLYHSHFVRLQSIILIVLP